MATEDHSPRIAVVMPYHNNLYDFLLAIARLGAVRMITPRSFRKKTQMVPPVPTVKIYETRQLGPISHAYNPVRLWRAIAPGTTHVLIKHLDLMENVVPAIIAYLRGAQLMVMVQQVHTRPLARAILIKVIATYLRYTHTKVFSVTKSGRQVLQNMIPRIHYIPACIDPQRFALAKFHHETSPELRILAIGKYIKRKNFFALVRAITIVRYTHPKLPLHLTLIGPPTDAQVLKDVQNLILTTGSLQHIVDARTDVAPAEIPEILSRHNLFVLPAMSEPLGFSLLEAMAAGLPVIATRQVGAADYIEEQRNGYVLPNPEPHTIASAIMEFCTPNGDLDSTKLQAFGRESRRIVERFHTPDAIIGQIAKMLV